MGELFFYFFNGRANCSARTRTGPQTAIRTGTQSTGHTRRPYDSVPHTPALRWGPWGLSQSGSLPHRIAPGGHASWKPTWRHRAVHCGGPCVGDGWGSQAQLRPVRERVYELGSKGIQRYC